METPNIQLYNLFRQDLHLTDNKSLELMHLLDKEYKSGVKEDIAALGRLLDIRFDKIDARFDKIDARFDKIDARFQTIDECLSNHDKRFDALDNKIDKNYIALDSKIDKNYIALDSKIDIKTAELRTEIHKSSISTIIWVISVILTLFGLAAALFKK